MSESRRALLLLALAVVVAASVPPVAATSAPTEHALDSDDLPRSGAPPVLGAGDAQNESDGENATDGGNGTENATSDGNESDGQTVTRTGACEGVAANESAVAATVPAGRTVIDGTVALHPGSELLLDLCAPANATGEWRLRASSDDRVEVLERGDDRVRVRVVADGEWWAGDLATGTPDAAPTIRAVDTGVETALVDGRLPVPSTDAAQRLRSAEETLDEREDAVAATGQNLSETVDAMRGGDRAPDGAANATLSTYREYAAAVDDLQRVLYDVGESGAGGPAVDRAFAALDDRERRATRELAAHLETYDRALAERERALVRTLRVRIVGLLGGGLLAGTVLGAALPLYRGRKARAALARGEWARYPRWVVLLPVVLGLLLLVGGLGWIAYELGWTLLEVVA